MRRWLIACLLVSPIAGHAKPELPPQPPADPGDFWGDVVEPNGDQVRVLLTKARAMMQAPDAALSTDAEWMVDQRTRFHRDAYNLLRHARKLSPENVEVLTMLGRAADELGKTRDAIDALDACVRLVGPEKAGAEVTGRLGAIHLRLGDRDTAIRWLRYAQGTNGPALVHLANALAARGEVTSAIETLQNALPARAIAGYLAPDVTLIAFALAVVYDRDEQRAAAFEILDQMQASLTTQYAQQVGTELFKLRFAPAEDEHYFRAFLYESLGHYTEARAEWALYAASTDSPWRHRALDHLDSIDKQRRANPTIKPTQIAPPGGRPLPRLPNP